MPCLVGCLALSFPRLAIVLVYLFSPGYFSSAYQTLIWPILGFIFMPLTTLAYAFAINQNGSVSGIYLVLVIVGVVLDLGLAGTGASSRRTRRVEVVRVKG